jgi:hypothetical protein
MSSEPISTLNPELKPSDVSTSSAYSKINSTIVNNNTSNYKPIVDTNTRQIKTPYRGYLNISDAYGNNSESCTNYINYNYSTK